MTSTSQRTALVFALTTLLAASLLEALDARLEGVNDWLYVLQPDADADLAALVASDFDLLVIDYSSDGGESGEFTAAEIAALKASGKVVIAYLSIGEAETFRYYWDPAWNDQGAGDPDAPAWLGPFNPDFPDNFKVRYWDPDWQTILFGSPSAYLDRILAQGFDGIYLDIIDAFTFWSVDQDEVEREDARQDMIALVQMLADYARTSPAGAPDFLVFPQNGSDVVLDDAEELDAAGEGYLAAIDGIGVEDLFYDELAPQLPADTAFRTAILELYLSSGGATRMVLSVDYVWDEVMPGGVANADRYNDYQALALAGGYVPYAAISDRDLDEVLTVDASGGFLLPQPKPPGVIFADGFESGDTTSWSQTTITVSWPRVGTQMIVGRRGEDVLELAIIGRHPTVLVNRLDLERLVVHHRPSSTRSGLPWSGALSC